MFTRVIVFGLVFSGVCFLIVLRRGGGHVITQIAPGDPFRTRANKQAYSVQCYVLVMDIISSIDIAHVLLIVYRNHEIGFFFLIFRVLITQRTQDTTDTFSTYDLFSPQTRVG